MESHDHRDAPDSRSQGPYGKDPLTAGLMMAPFGIAFMVVGPLRCTTFAHPGLKAIVFVGGKAQDIRSGTSRYRSDGGRPMMGDAAREEGAEQPQPLRLTEHGNAAPSPGRDTGRYEAYHEWSDEVLWPAVAELGGLMPGARAAKTAIAVGLAWWVGNLLGEPRPMFAALGALVAVESTIVASVKRTGLQLVGILGGVALAVILTYLAGLSALVVGLAVLFGLWIGRLFHSPDRVGVELSVTALLVVALGQGDVGFGVSRLWEVGLGGLVATVINALILPPNYVGEVARSLDELVEKVADGLSEGVRIFVELPHHEGAVETRHSLSVAREGIPAVQGRLRLAQDALRFSPLLGGEKESLSRYREALRLYNRAASHASRIARVVVQHAERPHSWSHYSHLTSTDSLLTTARSLARALRLFQSFVWHGDPVSLAEARQALQDARAGLASFYVAASEERADTAMERLVDVGAIAAELEHLALDAAEALGAVDSPHTSG